MKPYGGRACECARGGRRGGGQSSVFTVAKAAVIPLRTNNPPFTLKHSAVDQTVAEDATLNDSGSFTEGEAEQRG